MKKALCLALLSVCFMSKADFSFKDFFRVLPEEEQLCGETCSDSEKCLAAMFLKKYNSATLEEQEELKQDSIKRFVNWVAQASVEDMKALLVDSTSQKHFLSLYTGYCERQLSDETWHKLCAEIEQKAGEKLDALENTNQSDEQVQKEANVEESAIEFAGQQ